jgi:hypothetical protein
MKSMLKSLAGCAMALLLALPAWAIPIPDANRVTVNGVTWAQPVKFLQSWDEINAQCPDGACTSGSSLGTWDMAGWTWGGPDEVTALINYYLTNTGVGGSDLLDPTNLTDSYIVNDYATWIGAIAHDFRPTDYDHTGGYYLRGWAAKFPGQLYLVDLVHAGDYSRSRAAAFSGSSSTARFGFGAWFYCTDDCPSSQAVAAPPILPLIALALAGLVWSRRRPGGLRAILPIGPPA